MYIYIYIYIYINIYIYICIYIYIYIYVCIYISSALLPFFRVQRHSSGYIVLSTRLYDYPFYSYITLVQSTMSFVRVMLCMYVCKAALPYFRVQCHSSGYIALSTRLYIITHIQGKMQVFRLHCPAFKATGPFFRVQCITSGYIALPSRLHYPSTGSNAILQGTLPCLQGYIDLLQGTLPFFMVHCPAFKATLSFYRVHCHSSWYIALLQGILQCYDDVPLVLMAYTARNLPQGI